MSKCLKKHRFYYEFEAEDEYDLGFQMGKKFRYELNYFVNRYLKILVKRGCKIRNCDYEIKATKEAIPEVYKAISGYLKGSDVDINEYWNLFINSDVLNSYDNALERCTTIVTNNGEILAHSEDGSVVSTNEICIVKTKIKNNIKFEFHYYGSIGGDAIGVSSSGFAYSINNLYSTRKGSGVEKNFVARFLTNANSFDDIPKRIEYLKKYSTNCTFSYNFLNYDKKFINIEMADDMYDIRQPQLPTVHTNHYLGKLKKYENVKADINFYKSKRNIGTFNRYNYAVENTKKCMKIGQIKKLFSEVGSRQYSDIVNYYTDGLMIVDIEKMVAYVKLMREKKKGWLKYDISFMKKD